MISFFKNRKRVIYDRAGKIPYLVRYYIFLKDRTWFPFNFTLHKVLKSDEAVLHDHPWSYATLILKGGYWEHIPMYTAEGYVCGTTSVWRGPGHFRYRTSDDLHWLQLETDEDGNEIPCWSLFYMGRKAKSWGFLPWRLGKTIKDTGYIWVDSEEYLNGNQ